MSKHGTQAQRNAQMTTMRYRKEQDEAVAALVPMPPLLADVGSAFEAMRQQIIQLAPAIARIMEQQMEPIRAWQTRITAGS